jgi:HNH endonuclease
MEKHLNDWMEILQGMSNDNTYKLAWGRAIIEVILLDDVSVCKNDTYVIEFDEIAKKILKYYWNQIFFFNLKQSSNSKKPPIIFSIVSEIIEKYKKHKQTNIPIWFDRTESFFNSHSNDYDKTIKKISRTLKSDVCWRFLYANKKQYEIYRLSEDKTKVYINKKDTLIIKDYAIILTQIINYRWAQLLEQYNRSPKIASKVQGSIDNKIRRKNLKRFKDILIKQYKDNQIVDFYTSEALELNDISVDHVIPWSFMYSDDIWNLVLTSKANNSKKSNNIPTFEYIEKLKIRNVNLLNLIDDRSAIEELKHAIDQDFVTKFYYDAII